MPNSDPASQYTLLERLGIGSFGTVYKAYVLCMQPYDALLNAHIGYRMHNETKQIVAIKQIGKRRS
jgi:serine/threonine-protein kinase 24/25/MST4